jgi:hypothetical protein
MKITTKIAILGLPADAAFSKIRYRKFMPSKKSLRNIILNNCLSGCSGNAYRKLPSIAVP